MRKKLKKEIANKVMVEAEAKYDFKQVIDVPKEELPGIEESSRRGSSSFANPTSKRTT